MIRQFVWLAKAAAKQVNDTLREQKLLTPDESEEIASNAAARLVELVAVTQPEELVAAYFKTALMDLFVKHEVQRVQRQYRRRKQTKSLTTASGRDRDFVDQRVKGSQMNILEELNCPHAELVQRICIDGETVETVLPDRGDRRLWYEVQRPEVRSHLERHYPEWAATAMAGGVL